MRSVKCEASIYIFHYFLYLENIFIIRIGDEIVKQREYTNLSSRSTVDEENFKSSATVIIS